MDKIRMTGRQLENITAAPVEPVVESPAPETNEASRERKHAQTEENEKRIQQLKDELLNRGGMIIEPLKGDPFVLSRNHVPNRAEVTTYLPDGTIEMSTKAENNARLAREIAATSFFKQSQQENPVSERNSLGRLLAKGTGWLGPLFGGLFRKLMTSFRN